MPLIERQLSSSSVPSDLLRSVVDYFRPRQIILFGSRARGDAGMDSDIDLAVILGDDAPGEHLSARAARQSRGQFQRACDIVAWRNTDFQQHASVIGSLPHTVALEGWVVYGEPLDRRAAANMTAADADPWAQWAEAQRWLRVAGDDLRTVDVCLDANPPVTATAAYHCQQAAEKLLKALLVAAARPTRRTHDLDELADQAGEAKPTIAPLADACRFMTRWNFEFRYPSASHTVPLPPDPDEIRDARKVLVQLQAAVSALEPRRSAADDARTPASGDRPDDP